MKYGRKTAAVILSLILILSLLPVASFAEDGEGAASEGYEELSYGEGIDPDEIYGGEPDKLMEEFLLSDDVSSGIMTPEMPMSVKGDRLTGNDLKYYRYFKSLIKKVSAGKKASSSKKVKISKYLGKRTFTAKELGVKRIGYRKNGRWYVSNKAKKKIEALLFPEHWNKVYQSLLSDLSSQGYWVDWYSTQYFYEWHCPYRYDSNSVTFSKSAWLKFELPVMPEFAQSTYKADKSKINATITAKQNARYIVKTFDDAIPTTFAGKSPEIIDYNRLWYYCRVIGRITDYDYYTYNLAPKDRYWRGPWSMIYVFDGNESTKVVCTGYARALKYLCELSDFESDWIDCQILTGDAGGESHMWNVVRMNDGLNYLIDPTWMDLGVSAEGEDLIDEKWFLRGAPSGTANSYTIEGSFRKYDKWTRSIYATGERTLSKLDYYQGGGDREIKLKGPKLGKITKRKKSITVRWNKISTPIGALYVDGYQIQYSTKKNFSGAKTVTVKGYKKAAKTIRRLKRKQTYYVRIRTFAKVGRHKYYSKWSGKKKVRTK